MNFNNIFKHLMNKKIHLSDDGKLSIENVTDLQKNLDGKLDKSGGAMTGNIKFGTTNGQGIIFFDSDLYGIYMSSSDDTSNGGRIGETTSDYNMYFTMEKGTNRGFVFKNGTSIVAGIDGGGNIRAKSSVVSTNDIYEKGKKLSDTYALKSERGNKLLFAGSIAPFENYVIRTGKNVNNIMNTNATFTVPENGQYKIEGNSRTQTLYMIDEVGNATYSLNSTQSTNGVDQNIYYNMYVVLSKGKTYYFATDKEGKNKPAWLEVNITICY